MFSEEKIYVLDNKDRCIKLMDDKGVVVSLVFIKGDKLIIRGDLHIKESTILAPEIKILD